MKYDLTEVVLQLLSSLGSFLRRRVSAHLLRTMLVVSVFGVVGLIGFAVYSWQRVTVLPVGSGRAGGPAHTIATVVAEAVNRADTRVRIDVKETAGSIENTQLLAQKQLKLSMAVTTADVGPDAGLVGLLYPQAYLLAVRRDSAITSVSQLRGKRVGTPVQGTGSYDSFLDLMDHYGLTMENTQLKPMNANQLNGRFLAGELDAVFRVQPLRDALTAELLRSGVAELVAIDQLEALQAQNPSVVPIKIPRGLYRGGEPTVPERDMTVVGNYIALWADNSVDAGVVYTIAKALEEDRGVLAYRAEISGLTTTPDSVAQRVGFHPGAASYYEREKPNFFQRNASVLGSLSSTVPFLLSLYYAMRKRLQLQQKEQSDLSKKELVGLLLRLTNAHTEPELAALEDELVDAYRRVIEAVSARKISQDDFDSYSGMWDKAIGSVRHHLATIRGGFQVGGTVHAL